MPGQIRSCLYNCTLKEEAGIGHPVDPGDSGLPPYWFLTVGVTLAIPRAVVCPEVATQWKHGDGAADSRASCCLLAEGLLGSPRGHPSAVGGDGPAGCSRWHCVCSLGEQNVIPHGTPATTWDHRFPVVENLHVPGTLIWCGL